MTNIGPAAARRRRVSGEHRERTLDAKALTRAWRTFRRDATDVARNPLVEHYLYLVRFTAERIAAKLPAEVDVDDLMSAGIFGLVDAIDAFDPTRGVKFETYCAPRVRGAILDELRNLDWVPRLVRNRAQKLAEARRALEVELGRAPSDDEVAARLNASKAQFDKMLRDASSVTLLSISRRYSDSESDRDASEIDVTPDEDANDPVEESQKRDLRELLTHGLSRAERLIIVLYYYEQMTMKQIGQTLDLSESRVSQMHSAILERLRGHLQGLPGARRPGEAAGLPASGERRRAADDEVVRGGESAPAGLLLSATVLAATAVAPTDDRPRVGPPVRIERLPDLSRLPAPGGAGAGRGA